MKYIYSIIVALTLISVIPSHAESPAILPWTNAVPTNTVLRVRCNETERIEAQVSFKVASSRLDMAVTNNLKDDQIAAFREQYEIAREHLAVIEQELKIRGHVHEWIPTTNTLVEQGSEGTSPRGRVDAPHR